MFEFKIKNEYTVFLRLQDLEVYYGDNIDPNSNTVNTNIDINVTEVIKIIEKYNKINT